MAETIRDLLAPHAADLPAILAPDRAPLNHGALRQLVDATLATLALLGIGRNDRVAIVLPNGPEMATAFIALACGATTAPLEPGLPRGGVRLLPHRPAGEGARGRWTATRRPAVAVARRHGVAILRLHAPHDRPAGWFELRPERTAPVRSPASRSLRRTGRRRAGAAHVGHDFAAQDRAAAAAQPRRLGAPHPDHAGADAGRPLPQHHAAVPHPRPDRGGAVLARRRRLDLLHAGLQCAALLPLARGCSAHLVHGRADHAPGDPGRARSATPRRWPSRRLRFIRSSSASLPPQVMAALEETFGAPVIESYGMTEAAHQMASNPLPPGRANRARSASRPGREVAHHGDDGRFLHAGRRGRGRHLAAPT